jgi:hypothetical protein
VRTLVAFVGLALKRLLDFFTANIL